MENYYMFPAIFDYAPDGISINFPDIQGCLSCAFTTEDALFMARDALKSRLYICKRDGEIIPEPSDLLALKKNLRENQIIVPIDIYMPKNKTRPAA